MEQRRTLHARIVEAIEALYADRVVEQVERLAHHALRGEVWDKALAYCQAGRGKGHGTVSLSRGRGIFRAGAQWPSRSCQRRVTHASRPLISGSPCTHCARCHLGRHGARLRVSCVRPRPSRRRCDDHRRLGQVSALAGILFLGDGRRMTRLLPSAQRALALADGSRGGWPCTRWRTSTSRATPTMAQGDYRRAIDLPQSRPWRPSQGSTALRALRSGDPARRGLQCLTRLWPCRAWRYSPRAGAFGERRAPDIAEAVT